ncbi:hypothetical protein HY251_04495 [bacterium]|nr:hypothetical protein [bacterium]
MELSVLNINAWHGLYARTWWKAERLEPEGRKEQREQALVLGIRGLAPDVVALQECYPQPGFSKRVAAALDMDCVAQVSNAGLRLLGAGLPAGVDTGEGLSILARRGLSLRFLGAKNLSGLGFTSAIMSFQVVRKTMAVAAEVSVSGKTLAIVTGHVRYEWPTIAAFHSAWADLRSAGAVSGEPEPALLRSIEENIAVRDAEIEVLASWIETIAAGRPVIVAADMNVDDDAPQLVSMQKALGLTSALAARGDGRPTWEPARNPNIPYSSSYTHADGTPKDVASLVVAQHDRLTQRPDHVLLGKTFAREAALDAHVVLDEAMEGNVLPSDHFGILARIGLD